MAYDKEIQDEEGNIIRVYTSTDGLVRMIGEGFPKELVFNRHSALRFINTILGAMNKDSKVQVETKVKLL